MNSSPECRNEGGLWQRQFSSEFDFEPTPVRTRLALLTTPRCGSHLLGHSLHASGCFGYPLEYANPGNWREWRKRARHAGAEDTLEYLKSIRTGPNGVFAIKLHYEHLERFLAEERGPLTYSFVHLTRGDPLAQAVSFARAELTGSWISDMPAKAEAHYDFDLILAKLEAVLDGNAGWAAFLAATGTPSIHLTYEEVAADPGKAVGKIAGFSGVDLDANPELESFKPKPQRKTTKSEDWAGRFSAEFRARVQDGHSSVVRPSRLRPSARSRIRQWIRLRVDDARGN